MERILQWLDDLDDLYGVVGLLAERIRRILAMLARVFTLVFVATGGVAAALIEPPFGLAIAILLFVFLLYRSVTQPGFAVRNRQAIA